MKRLLKIFKRKGLVYESEMSRYQSRVRKGKYHGYLRKYLRKNPAELRLAVFCATRARRTAWEHSSDGVAAMNKLNREIALVDIKEKARSILAAYIRLNEMYPKKGIVDER